MYDNSLGLFTSLHFTPDGLRFVCNPGSGWLLIVSVWVVLIPVLSRLHGSFGDHFYVMYVKVVGFQVIPRVPTE